MKISSIIDRDLSPKTVGGLILVGTCGTSFVFSIILPPPSYSADVDHQNTDYGDETYS